MYPWKEQLDKKDHFTFWCTMQWFEYNIKKIDPFESNGKTAEHHFGLKGVYMTNVLFWQ